MLGFSKRMDPGGVIPKFVGIAMAIIKIVRAAGGRLAWMVSYRDDASMRHWLTHLI